MGAQNLWRLLKPKFFVTNMNEIEQNWLKILVDYLLLPWQFVNNHGILKTLNTN